MTTIEEYANKHNEVSENNEYAKIPLIENEWGILSDRAEINTYLPKDNSVTITTGIKTLKKDKIDLFGSINVSQAIKNKRGHILNTGGSIWALDFVPIKASKQDNNLQYLAIGGYNSTDEHCVLGKKSKGCRNAIQIYRCATNSDQKPVLDICILHDFGYVMDFKWCPFSVYDEEDKLGILAVLFNDGEVRLLVVPNPHFLRKQKEIQIEEPIYIRVQSPRLLLSLPGMFNLCLNWGAYHKLACGTKSGNLIVWDILGSLLSKSPTLIINIPHVTPVSIRSISWLSLLDGGSLLISSDSDGNINLHDLSDPFLPSKIFRSRCTYICLSGTGHGEGFLFGDMDGVTRRNTTFNSKKTVSLTMHNSLVWSISTSSFHGIMAASASDGTVMIKPFSNSGYAVNPKHKLNILEYTLYKLVFDTDSNEFRYIDGLKPKTNLPERIYHNVLIDPIVSLQKVAWNNNKNACGWVASGGKAGLCRIEFTGCS